MRTKRLLSTLLVLTALNTVGVVAVLSLRYYDHRQQAMSLAPGDLASLYASMSASELSLRFCRPDLFAGSDDFARPNALDEILKRRYVKRGMHADEVRRVLGSSFDSVGLTLGQQSEWSYSGLFASGLTIQFGADERVTKIQWQFDHPHQDWSREL